MTPVVKFKRLRGHRLPLPAYHSEHAAGMDLMAEVEASFTISPMVRVAVPTGFAVEIPPGFEGQVRPRSGRAFKQGLTIVNAPGTIDADYRGELQVILINLGAESFSISRGVRIAQLVIAPVAKTRWREVSDLDLTPRGNTGFGSTGA